MSVPSPTEELRTAAQTIRDLIAADGMQSGSWTITPRYRKGTKTVVQYEVEKPPKPGIEAPERKIIHPSRTDALYNAYMHPGVGLALANWLDREADLWDLVETVKTEYGPKGLSVTTPLSTHDQALAVARQINGTA